VIRFDSSEPNPLVCLGDDSEACIHRLLRLQLPYQVDAHVAHLLRSRKRRMSYSNKKIGDRSDSMINVAGRVSERAASSNGKPAANVVHDMDSERHERADADIKMDDDKLSMLRLPLTTLESCIIELVTVLADVYHAIQMSTIRGHGSDARTWPKDYQYNDTGDIINEMSPSSAKLLSSKTASTFDDHRKGDTIDLTDDVSTKPHEPEDTILSASTTSDIDGNDIDEVEIVSDQWSRRKRGRPTSSTNITIKNTRMGMTLLPSIPPSSSSPTTSSCVRVDDTCESGMCSLTRQQQKEEEYYQLCPSRRPAHRQPLALTPTLPALIITKEQLVDLLKQENDARLSPVGISL
jgi:hypothetical protein